MKEQRLLTLLLEPHVSEKSSQISNGYRQYVFKVVLEANKPQVKEAVEHIFNVKVKSVRICNMKGKPARFGRTLGRRQAWKKAYVTLAQDQEIDIAGQQS